MCGIAGILGGEAGREPGGLEAIAGRMGLRLAHRGPDAGGVWADAGSGVALSHRRLSIIDVSPLGAQPMQSADGRWVMVLNGEIYNFPELRGELESAGARFRGHSDTEVLLEAVSAWGVERALTRSNGMFAFGLWDRKERRLYLARDRVGEKPLYLGKVAGGWVFGSELKALRAHPGFEGEVDRDALALYLRYGYVPAPWCIYRGVRKLRPGTLVSLAVGEEPREQAYWSAGEAFEKGAREPYQGTTEEALERVEGLLRESVKMRMQSDVPLGAFLSGGVDSSTVVAMMQAQSSQRVKTFTIGFPEDEFDEGGSAREVARHLGTDHAELYVTGEDARGIIPELPEIYDEPFADSSGIPTTLVSRLARGSVTVSLSGDGGDELFGGYLRYVLAEAAWGSVSRIPGPLRPAARATLGGMPDAPWRWATRLLEPLLPAKVSRLSSSWRRRQMAQLMGCANRQELYRALVSMWTDPAALCPGSREPATSFTEPLPKGLRDYLSEMTYTDLMAYLPDDILVKLDRASMSVGLEARVPLLDHRLVELAASLPHDVKIRDGAQKWILKQILHRYVPRQLVDRPKMGFAVPMAEWIRGPLRSWAEDLLSHDGIAREGFLDPAPVTKLLADHLAGREDAQFPLWTVLSFQAWVRAQRSAQD
jgi:asparagine synthase (glutamine-hydrolysing)